jgi:hypothetical protein
MTSTSRSSKDGARDAARQPASGAGDERDPQMREFLLSLSPLNAAN